MVSTWCSKCGWWNKLSYTGLQANSFLKMFFIFMILFYVISSAVIFKKSILILYIFLTQIHYIFWFFLFFSFFYDWSVERLCLSNFFLLFSRYRHLKDCRTCNLHFYFSLQICVFNRSCCCIMLIIDYLKWSET